MREITYLKIHKHKRAGRYINTAYADFFFFISDGKSLVAGGRSNLIHLWCLDSQQLVRVIQMPTQVRTVRQLEFLPDSFDRGASQVQQDLPAPHFVGACF